MSSNISMPAAIAIMLLLALGTPEGRAAAVAPNPPPQICIGSTCKTTPGGTSQMKWHPGHYAQDDIYMTTSPATDGTFDRMDRMAAVVDSSGNPPFKGFCIQFGWAAVEPTTQGNYNSAMITAINAVRTRLQTNYKYNGVVVPLRLIIKIRIESQGGTGALPAYVVSGISGNGSDAISATQSAGPGGFAAAMWRAPVMSAYINMLNHLGSLYDSDPYVEAIIALEETAIGYDSPPSDYSGAAFYTQVQNLINGLTSWPTTIKTIYPNFGPIGTTEAWINTAIAFSYAKGWGAGGPDLLVPATGVTWGALDFLGVSGSNGVNYQGKMPNLIGVESDIYLWHNQTSAGDESYAFNTLHPTHILWGVYPQSIYQPLGYGNSSQWWETGTVPALQAVNFRISASALTCPTIYVGGCNTQ